MTILSKMLTPIHYLTISHNEKRWFDFVLPIVMSSMLVLGMYLLPKQISLLGKDGLITLVNGMLQILSGFYIASMAAVATFQKAGMDDVMTGAPPILKGKKLSRRKFLTYLFGYLAFMSMAMYFVGGSLQLMSGNLIDWSYFNGKSIRLVSSFIYLFWVSNILTTTALGMYFMIDKMHDERPRLNSPDEDKD